MLQNIRRCRVNMLKTRSRKMQRAGQRCSRVVISDACFKNRSKTEAADRCYVGPQRLSYHWPHQSVLAQYQVGMDTVNLKPNHKYTMRYIHVHEFKESIYGCFWASSKLSDPQGLSAPSFAFLAQIRKQRWLQDPLSLGRSKASPLVWRTSGDDLPH